MSASDDVRKWLAPLCEAMFPTSFNVGRGGMSLSSAVAALGNITKVEYDARQKVKDEWVTGLKQLSNREAEAEEYEAKAAQIYKELEPLKIKTGRLQDLLSKKYQLPEINYVVVLLTHYVLQKIEKAPRQFVRQVARLARPAIIKDLTQRVNGFAKLIKMSPNVSKDLLHVPEIQPAVANEPGGTKIYLFVKGILAFYTTKDKAKHKANYKAVVQLKISTKEFSYLAKPPLDAVLDGPPWIMSVVADTPITAESALEASCG